MASGIWIDRVSDSVAGEDISVMGRPSRSPVSKEKRVQTMAVGTELY